MKKRLKQKKSKVTVRSGKPHPKWFYLVLLLIPLLFLILLEAGLRIFNYGMDLRQWVNITEEKYILNPETARRYFYSTVGIPYSIQNSFDVVKKKNSFRVFILGESSAAGYPFSPNGDFGRYIKKRLETEFPESVIEVVNLGLTAVNTYALRDLLPGILEEDPDLILVYTGHNEYYGALGVGSLESLGNYPFVVNTALYLNRLRTFQLIRNIISSAAGLFGSPETDPGSGGTLMARMAQDKLIKLNSGVYHKGLEQYESNMQDILEMAGDSGVPVILSTLASNLKDQPPFIPAETPGYPGAAEVFTEAQASLKQGNISRADSLFRLAKDLDALKFRAPEALNDITRKFASSFNCPVAEVDEEFNNASPGGITGNNLMVDHLHPALHGYQLMGKIFYKKMKETGNLPRSKRIIMTDETADSIAIENFYFSELDSIIARYRIILLKNDWPFSERKSTKIIMKEFGLRGAIDSIALKVVDNKTGWEAAHRSAAVYYFNNRNYDSYLYEMNVLIDHYPFITEYYDRGAENLLEVKKFELAYEILERRYHWSPTAFSTKWLGIIDLSRNETDSAIKYLEESIKYNNNDAQVFFNLSGAYSFKKEYQKSLESINRCLTIDPRFPGAAEFREQLTLILENQSS